MFGRGMPGGGSEPVCNLEPPPREGRFVSLSSDELLDGKAPRPPVNTGNLRAGLACSHEEKDA